MLYFFLWIKINITCVHVKKIFLSAESGLARPVGYSMFSVSLGSGIYRAPTRKGATVESTKEPFRVLTSRRPQRLTSSTDIILLHCDFFFKKKKKGKKNLTLLRLWLQQMERRTESEGKEWVEPRKAENEMERGERGSSPASAFFKFTLHLEMNMDAAKSAHECKKSISTSR